MTAQKRLEAIEKLYRQRIEAHISIITPMFTQRFDGPELIAVSQLLHAVANEDHDAGLAATGAALLAGWRAELSRERWAAMWLLADVRESIDAALSVVSPTQLSTDIIG